MDFYANITETISSTPLIRLNSVAHRLVVVDSIVQVSDRDSFLMTRKLVREEGTFRGGSSGSVVQGAIKYAEENQLNSDDILVVILPDSGSRYLSKVFDDDARSYAQSRPRAQSG